MRIISKFQDYYDRALAYGFENDRVLVRHNQAWDARGQGEPENVPANEVLQKLQAISKSVAPFDAFGAHNRYEKRPKNEHLQITPLVFCVGGRVTKALWVLDIQSVRLNNGHNRSSSYSRTDSPSIPPLNPANEYSGSGTYQPHPSEKVHQDGPIFDAKEFEQTVDRWKKYYEQNQNSYNLEKLEKLEKWLNEPAPDLYVAALASELSIAIAHPEGMALNPSLKDWKFFKYWDAPTCMQEISMFVGNMSAPEKAPVAMDDKYRVHSHGFNEQSFRKQPTKHGLPKRAKRPHPDTPIEIPDSDSSPAP